MITLKEQANLKYDFFENEEDNSSDTFVEAEKLENILLKAMFHQLPILTVQNVEKFIQFHVENTRLDNDLMIQVNPVNERHIKKIFDSYNVSDNVNDITTSFGDVEVLGFHYINLEEIHLFSKENTMIHTCGYNFRPYLG
ncbi:hypothetical protein ACKXGF_07415 [Alkalibacillus sp. S2W]|uniref:hypothetical protein n=1 Tax=Alkalibacillus sp. S2W TaxID=3386553 RepID=UPI00398D2293